MPIISSVEAALEMKSKIQSAGHNIRLFDVAQVSVTGVSAHSKCEQIYASVIGNLDTYENILSRDSNNISAIAQGFEAVDQQVKKNFGQM
ncbi:MAG: TIGR04197 family type VII secretion effector [Lachnospiraceae bacterium]|nr:TIGR04197 family type VII secretion effector [Lachnospiraceae bacterium]